MISTWTDLATWEGGKKTLQRRSKKSVSKDAPKKSDWFKVYRVIKHIWLQCWQWHLLFCREKPSLEEAHINIVLCLSPLSSAAVWKIPFYFHFSPLSFISPNETIPNAYLLPCIRCGEHTGLYECTLSQFVEDTRLGGMLLYWRVGRLCREVWIG